eukprot:15192079-Alexandrium_andersonii.AAC.1
MPAMQLLPGPRNDAGVRILQGVQDGLLPHLGDSTSTSKRMRSTELCGHPSGRMLEVPHVLHRP